MLLWGCQQTPSTVVQRDGNLEQRLFSRIQFEGDVDFGKAVIIDVRPRFQFEVSKLPRSFHALVEDWDLKNYSGIELDKKRQELQRLLSLKGIDPPTQVVILGYGLKGKGEEFLVASTLVSLGVKRLHFLNIEKAKKSLGSKELEPVANAPKWDKEFVQLFNCRHQKMDERVEARSASKSLATANPAGAVGSQSGKVSEKKTPVKTPSKTASEPVDIVIGSKPGQEKPSNFFNEDLEFIAKNIPKRRGLQVSSPQSYWAYGLALYLADQGQQPCVL